MTTILRSSRRGPHAWPYLVLSVVSLILLACSGDPESTEAGSASGSGGGGTGGTGGAGALTPCESAGTTLCERACACDTSEKCSVASESGVVIYFDDENKCKGLYVTGNCSAGGSPKIDYAKCNEDLDSAMCNAEKNAAVIPKSCTESDP